MHNRPVDTPPPMDVAPAAGERELAVAQAAIAAFGGAARMHRYARDGGEHVGVVVAADHPAAGITSYATVGASGRSIGLANRGTEVRVEFVGAAYARFAEFPIVLAGCAVNVLAAGYSGHPGAIYAGLVRAHREVGAMGHVLLVRPRLWGDRLRTLDLPGLSIAWLMAVPISDAERRHAEQHGSDALEQVLGGRAVDVFDLDRPSAV
jgi:hypothetical protein